MKKLGKKIVSSVLAASLFVTAVPVMTFGAEEPIESDEIEFAVAFEEGSEQRPEVLPEQEMPDLLAAGDIFVPDVEKMEAAQKRAAERAAHYLSGLEEEVLADNEPFTFAKAITSFGGALGSSVLGGFVGYGINKLMDLIFGDPTDKKLEEMQKKLDEVCRQLDTVKTMVSQISEKIDEILRDTSEIKKGLKDLLSYNVYEKLSGYLDDMKALKTGTVRNTYLALKDVDADLEKGVITKEEAEQERISLLIDSFGMDVSNPHSCASVTSYIDLYTEGMTNAVLGGYSVMLEDKTIRKDLTIFDIYYEILLRDPAYPTQDDAAAELLAFYSNTLSDYNITTAVEGLSLNARIKVIEDYNKSGKGYISTRALKNTLAGLKEKNASVVERGQKYVDLFDTTDYLYLWKDNLFVSKHPELMAGSQGENKTKYSGAADARASLRSVVWGQGAPASFANTRVREYPDQEILGPTELNPDINFWAGLWHGCDSGREFISKPLMQKIIEYGRRRFGQEDSMDNILRKMGFILPYTSHWDKVRIFFKPVPEDPMVYYTLGGDFGYQEISVLSYPNNGNASWESWRLFQYYDQESHTVMVGRMTDFYGIPILEGRPKKEPSLNDDEKSVLGESASENDTEPEETELFTGTWDRPVTDGNWEYSEIAGTWSYRAGRLFRNTWACIANPYAKESRDKAGWFLFDAKGIMLTGWQYVNGKWFYLKTTHDGTYGACLLGPARTPDGYEVDETGAWTGK